VRYLTKCLEQLKIVDYSPQQEGKVFFGAWVEIENDDGDTSAFASSATMKFLAAKTTSPSTRRWRARC
jgi:transcription elongation GreA/GreB family factor